MSRTKDYLEDQLREKAETVLIAQLAEGLGLSKDELAELEWEIEPHQTEDGLIYGYYIEFSEDSNPAVLERLGATNRRIYVGPNAFDSANDYYDKGEFDWEASSRSHFSEFYKVINNIESLADLRLPQNQQFALHVMLFMHTMSAFEYLLYRAFLHEVTWSKFRARKLIESDPILATRKINLRDIFQTYDSLDEIVVKHVKDVIFHRVEKIIPMYRDVLGFSFGKCKWLGNAVVKRHDCAHRAGYTKDGDPVELNLEIIAELIQNCKNMAETIELHLDSTSDA
jgi:hypothetical protein